MIDLMIFEQAQIQKIPTTDVRSSLTPLTFGVDVPNTIASILGVAPERFAMLDFNAAAFFQV
jgi:hypothetical protein